MIWPGGAIDALCHLQSLTSSEFSEAVHLFELIHTQNDILHN